MKLCTYSLPTGATRLGLVDETAPDHVLDVQAAAPSMPQLASLQSLLEADADTWNALRDLAGRTAGLPTVALADDQWCAPLPRPASLRDCLSFELHWIQCAREVADTKVPLAGSIDRFFQSCTGWSLLRPPRVWRERPVYYKGNRRSVVGHGAAIQWPRYSQRLDFELEIAVYIGKEGADIPHEAAAQYVAGYSLFNDFSARDVQFREMDARLGPSKSKDFDTGNSLGPFMATPDEVNLSTLSLQVVVNGDVWTEADATSLYHSVPDTISFLSQSETLFPGDVIGLGTVPNGCGLELGRWLQPGDVVELRSNQLGTLRNHVHNADVP